MTPRYVALSWGVDREVVAGALGLEPGGGRGARLPLARFTPAGVAGEALWVAIYTLLGYDAFADRIVALGGIMGNASGALAAGAMALGLGLRLRAALRDRAA